MMAIGDVEENYNCINYIFPPSEFQARREYEERKKTLKSPFSMSAGRK